MECPFTSLGRADILKEKTGGFGMRQYVVDAFTDKVFGGNPAAVCVLDTWPGEGFMQSLAMENNLSETAFAVKEGERYGLRWFTPGGEVELCGHATLATAFVIMNHVEPGMSAVEFSTRSGVLRVERQGELYELDLPAFAMERSEVTEELCRAYGAVPAEVWVGADLVCVFEDEETVRKLKPDPEAMKGLFGVVQHATARGRDYDCVTRSFGPKCAVAEDPVCGRGHCHVAPYWAARLRKEEIRAWQASARGGELRCRSDGERVKIAGKAVLFAVSEVFAAE